MSAVSRLYTIPSGADFVRELAAGLRARFDRLDDPFALSDCLVLLPTRRAIRALQQAFAATPGTPAILLPRMRALGDWDAYDQEADDPAAWSGRELTPPPVAPLERDLALTEMVLTWARKTEDLSGDGVRLDPSMALALAQDLAALLDAAALERIDWSRLGQIVDDKYAAHWSKTLDFLKIVTQVWPGFLSERGRSDPGLHRDSQLRSLAGYWAAHPPRHPVIIAGSTGSVKATQDLMAAVLTMPDGAVILPGLDLELDEDAWSQLGPDHPQFVMRELLTRLDYTRADAGAWTAAQGRPARARLLAEALRPAAAAGAWPEFIEKAKPHAAAMAAGLSVMESPTPHAEAKAIALILREALETPDATAALITPNRNLARRVAAEMRRWGVAVDDSAGRPLAKTPIGALMTLILRAVDEAFAPVPLLALLKHPLCRLGLSQSRKHALTLRLEIEVLRGPRPGPGFAGLRAALDASGDTNLHDLVVRLEEAFAAMAPAELATVPVWATRLRAVASAVTAGSEDDPWTDEPGEAAAALLTEIEMIEFLTLELDASAAGRVLERVMDGRAVRYRQTIRARIDILGPLEARLQTADVVVLGGLNEPGWPAAAEVDGWLNRPMRQDMALSQPERRIGQSAHDFMEAACAPRVILSRALKEGASPANPSRWLVRLDALTKSLDLDLSRAAAHYAGWSANLDASDVQSPGSAPEPRPPLAARLRSLSVTQVEQWVRDPYAHYVQRILKLAPLDPIDHDPGGAEKGTFIHRALELFVQQYPKAIPENAEAELARIGREVAQEMAVRPGVMAVWWPRYLRIAKWFVEWDRPRRALLVDILTETSGTMSLPDVNFTVRAKADRIDVAKDGSVLILDYKTGKPPTLKEIESGFASQLPLESAMAIQGGFAGLAPKATPLFHVLHLTGRGNGGKVEEYKGHEELVARAMEGLKRRIRIFDRLETPYVSRPSVKFQRYTDDFAYIARTAERLGGEEGEDA
jgi:ATP-dependent helicase/nuclease subunit B